MSRRAKGDGWLEERAGRYIACMKYRKAGDTKTRLYRKSTGFFVDRGEHEKAEEFRRQWTAEMRAGKLSAPAGPPPAMLRDLRDEMLRDVRKNGRKYEARVTQCFAHLEAYFGEKKVAAEIDGEAIDAYIDARMDPKKGAAKAGTTNRELSVLKRAFRLYKKNSNAKRKLAAVPDIELLEEKNIRKRLAKDEEVEKVFAELPDRLKAPMRFLQLAGWRVSEVLGLQWQSVDEDACVVRLEADQTKGGDVRELPYAGDPTLSGIIQERREATDAWNRWRPKAERVEYVFWFEGTDEKCRPAALPNSEYRRAWERACKRAKVTDLHVHDLRRAYARKAILAGVDEETIMTLAGWRTRSMFSRYSIRNNEDRAAAVAKMARARATAELQAKQRATAKQSA
jgi:integrase